MNSARVRSASGPSARRISEISNSAVGQTSGQWVKPKNTRNGRPLRSWSVIGLPSWSISRNGPPILAAALMTGAGLRPVTIRMTVKKTTSPARNAERMRSTRDVAVFIGHSSASETEGQAREDHLVEHRGSIVGPQRRRSRKNDPYGPGEGEDQRTRCAVGDGLGHGTDIRPIAASGNRPAPPPAACDPLRPLPIGHEIHLHSLAHGQRGDRDAGA